ASGSASLELEAPSHTSTISIKYQEKSDMGKQSSQRSGRAADDSSAANQARKHRRTLSPAPDPDPAPNPKHGRENGPDAQGTARSKGTAVDGGKPERADDARLAIHPLALLFPPMSTQEFNNLKTGISESGLLEPIVRHEGKILDDRNRYRACVKL